MADDANPPSETPEIHDPMSLRDTDTSRLKRIKPQTSLRVANVDGSTEVGSETVHLKVIKEKKKQLAGILSASQTIRLRPSGGEASPAGPAPSGDAPKPGTLKLRAPGPKDAATSKVSRAHRSPDELVAGDQKSPTLKLRAPGAGAAAPTQAAPAAGGTLKLKAPTAGTPATQAAPAAGGGRATLKLKAPGEQKLKTHSLPRVSQPGAPAEPPSEAETSALSKSTLKLRAPSPASAKTQQAPAAGSPGTLKLRAPGAPSAPAAGDGGSKATLKLRAPGAPGTDTGAAPASPGTLKLKAPSSPTIEAPAPGGAGETVKQEAPKPGKTLKLRSTPSTGAPKDTAAPASEPAYEPAAEYAPVGTHPGILYTLGAVASLAIMGATCYLTIAQYLELFQIK